MENFEIYLNFVLVKQSACWPHYFHHLWFGKFVGQKSDHWDHWIWWVCTGLHQGWTCHWHHWYGWPSCGFTSLNIRDIKRKILSYIVDTGWYSPSVIMMTVYSGVIIIHEWVVVTFKCSIKINTLHRNLVPSYLNCVRSPVTQATSDRWESEPCYTENQS